MYRPPYIAFDFESEENGEASTEFYRPGFYISSCAFAWRDSKGEFKTKYFHGAGCEKQIRAFLAATKGIPLVVHNATFESGVILCRFPGLLDELEPLIDTMRLVQNLDNGGGEFQFMPLTFDEQLDQLLHQYAHDESKEKAPPKKTRKNQPTQKYIGGLGLRNAAIRILGIEDHKKKAHEWLRENVPECRKGSEGSFLHMLPPALLEEYDIADTITTARLYEHCIAEFKRIGFDWTIDHGLYRSTLRHIVESKIAGVKVLRENLAQSIESLHKEVSHIEETFRNGLAEEIRSVERARLLRRITKLKTLRGRKAYLRRLRISDPGLFANEIQFNLGSSLDLEALFLGELKQVAKFLTEKGQPTFRSACLGQYGPHGEQLKTRRKRLLVMKQCEALHSLSEFDNRMHFDLRVAGTATSRAAGGSGE